MYSALNENMSLDSSFLSGFSFSCCFYSVGVFVYAYLCTVLDKKALKTRELNTYAKTTKQTRPLRSNCRLFLTMKKS